MSLPPKCEIKDAVHQQLFERGFSIVSVQLVDWFRQAFWIDLRQIPSKIPFPDIDDRFLGICLAIGIKASDCELQDLVHTYAIWPYESLEAFKQGVRS